ncbi:MAG TPA: glycosyltransferase family 87 protein [Gemmataceae bacterium]|nr:glycosyltransferase family 87 protein [Gemmataceae bacterium]
MTIQGQNPPSPSARLPGRGMRVLGCLLALAAAVYVTINLGIPLAPERLPTPPGDPDAPPRYRVLDFSQEWASARNLFNAKPIYRDHNEAICDYLGFHRDLSDPNIYYSLQVNAHPPTSVLLGIPFAWMEYHHAFLAWNVLSLAAVIASGWLVVRQLGVRVTLTGLLITYVLVLLYSPFRQQFSQGQLNAVLLLLITGAWAAERSARPGLAGVLLAVAAAVKFIPAFLLLYYAVRGRWRVVWSGVACLAAVTVLTVLVLGSEAFTTYFGSVMPHVATTYADGWINASLPGFFKKLFEARSGHIEPLLRSPALCLIGIVLADLAVVLVTFVVARRARTRAGEDLAFGLAIVAMLLVAPITWDHYFLLLLIPLVLVGMQLRKLGGWIWLFFLCLVPLWLAPLWLYKPARLGSESLEHPAQPWQVLTGLSLQCYALVGLFAVLTAAASRERGTGPGGPAT